MSRRGRSRKGYVVEYLLAFVAIVAIWAFLTNGGPSAAVGDLFQ